MIKRERYMSQIRPFIGRDLIKVMTGIRRSGKSVMLELVKEELVESGVDPANFISINFEDMRYSNLLTAKALHDEVMARAEGVEANHEGRIATMENFWKAADDPEGTIDKLAEIVSYIESDKSGALDMAADIQANTEAIAAIYTPAEGETAASGILATEIERAKAAEKANADAIAAINNETDGILAQAKKYTDDSIAALPFATAEKAGLVKSSTGDNKVTVEEDGTMTIKQMRVSVGDLYVPEDDELVMNGGGAAGY